MRGSHGCYQHGRQLLYGSCLPCWSSLASYILALDKVILPKISPHI